MGKHRHAQSLHIQGQSPKCKTILQTTNKVVGLLRIGGAEPLRLYEFPPENRSFHISVSCLAVCECISPNATPVSDA